MRRRCARPRPITLLVLIGAAVTSCNGQPPDAASGPAPASTASSSSPSPSPGNEVITWVDGVCTAQQARLGLPPPPAVAADPTERDRPAVLTYLTQVRDAFRQSKTIFEGLGRAPVHGGDELVTAELRALDEIVPELEENLRNAGRFPAPEFGAPFRIAAIDVASFTVDDPQLADLLARDEGLAEAHERAPGCSG
jgi:hypothetical protein